MDLTQRDIASDWLHDIECSFQLMHYLMKWSFHSVPGIKQMDLLLFLSKKKDQQHMTNLLQRNLEGIWNPLKIIIYKFLLILSTSTRCWACIWLYLIILILSYMEITFGEWVRCSFTTISGFSWIFHIASTLLFFTSSSSYEESSTGNWSSELYIQ